MSERPKLLDLFCGAGGAAMGYYRAGFDVVGVDIAPQNRYPFEFVQADALDFLDGDGWLGFDMIHVSPPCQYYSRLRHLPWLRNRDYWRSIPPVRAALGQTGLPYVIENVEDAAYDMPDSVIICGQSLGLPLYRHRRFECSSGLLLVSPCSGHRDVIMPGRRNMAKRYAVSHVGVKEISRDSVAGHVGGIRRVREAMGIDWMTRDELAQAIPPAYTEFIGRQLLKHLARGGAT